MDDRADKARCRSAGEAKLAATANNLGNAYPNQLDYLLSTSTHLDFGSKLQRQDSVPHLKHFTKQQCGFPVECSQIFFDQGYEGLHVSRAHPAASLLTSNSPASMKVARRSAT